MWLIETQTLKLRQVINSSGEKYIILSHTWNGDDEISFQSIQDLGKAEAEAKAGFQKVKKTCDIAHSRNYKYAWIDTCCIDKTSSAELSEAINSMFQWYRDAKICYVYLSDFEPLPFRLSEKERLSQIGARLRQCRYFTRGWTLQELIAPKKMEFFDRDWNFIGGKEDLLFHLSSVTNIERAILQDSSGLRSIPIARKMSWAAKRETTRLEDRAYSLLGIFDINMPLLYGEGPKAFLRLQQQIASENNDLSLFAWQCELAGPSSCNNSRPGQSSSNNQVQFSGIFANSPNDFRHCSTLKKHIDQFKSTDEFAVTNSGLRMQNRLHCPDPSASGDTDFLLSLDCVETSARTNGRTQWLAITLTRVGETFLRRRPDAVVTADSRTAWGAPPRPKKNRNTWTRMFHEGLMQDWAATTHAPQNIYIQTMLRQSDAQRVSSLLGTGITIVYGANLVEGIRNRSGMPADSCGTNSDKGVFVFDARGRDNFLAVHKFQIQRIKGSQSSAPTDTFVVVCSLQWNGTSYQLRVGLFEDSDDALKDCLTGDGPKGHMTSWRPEDAVLQDIKDSMLIRYSDLSGFLVRSMMPSAKRTALLGRTGSLMVRPLQQLENPVGGIYQWKEGYYHVLLEHRPSEDFILAGRAEG